MAMDNLLAHAVKETKTFGTQEAGQNYFHIALAGTTDYIPRLGVVLWSAAKSNPDLPLAFHLFVNALPADEENKLREAVHQLHCVIYVHIVDDEGLRPLMAEKSKAAYSRVPAYWYRFVVPATLKRMTDRVLYLDGDVMCYGSLKELVKLDFHGNIAAVVSDRGEQHHAEEVGSDRFFNSGMMLINISQWEKERMFEKTADLARKSVNHIDARGRCKELHGAKYNDQNILNVLLDGKLLFLPTKYNYIYVLTFYAFMEKQPENKDFRDQIIIHFAGHTKPWHSWVQEWPVVRAYASIQSTSPWKNILLTFPKDTKSLHQAARSARVHQRYGEMVKWYVKYLWKKLYR